MILFLSSPSQVPAVAQFEPQNRVCAFLAQEYCHRFEVGESRMLTQGLANILFKNGDLRGKEFPMIAVFSRSPNGFNAQWYDGPTMEVSPVSSWIESL